MGYINSATATTLTAKLTPIGRRKLILSNNNLITHFSLGDSDANYYAALSLQTGQIPNDGGDNGPYSSLTNGVGPNTSLKSMLLVNSNGDLKKNVEEGSSEVTSTLVNIGTTTATSTRQNIIDRTSLTTDPLVNLYHSFSLPLTTGDDFNFTGVTSAFGGFSDTALSGVAQSKILVFGIENSQYGEVIDGKAVRIDIQGISVLYTIYSTFQNTGESLSIMDARFDDKSESGNLFNGDVAFLFSDNIMSPNGGDVTLSWSTGFGTVKPFSVNGKQLFNLTTNSNIGKSADTLVGIVYLDKGFVVITDQTIVNDFDVNSGFAIVTCDSLSTSVVQNVTCIASRNEFAQSTNRTFTNGSIPRISEVGLYDDEGDLIAIAKSDRHILKNPNEFLALGIKFSV
jgi:hypothetical protein